MEMEEQQSLPILPDEIWLKIFGELSSDRKNLLTATLVCKQWNDLISNSKFLKNVECTIIVTKPVVDDINKGRFKITRKYRDLRIEEDFKESRQGTHETYIKLLDIITASLADHLVSFDCNIQWKTRLENLVKLLSHYHIIENLNLSELKIDEKGSENLHPMKLKHLKSLKLNKKSKILDFIECTTLEKFYVERLTDHVIKFLNRLDQLDELHIEEYFEWQSKILLQPKFRWCKLHLGSGSEVASSSSNLLATAFAGLEALGSASMDKAKVRILDQGSDKMMIPILNNCKNIEELTFNCTSFPSNTSMLRQMEEIEKLNLIDMIEIFFDRTEEEQHIRSFINILSKMPNVKHLFLECPSSFILNLERETNLFANVTLLEMSFSLLEKIHTHFPNLTTLLLEDNYNTLINHKKLATFCKFHQNLKNLKVKVTLNSTVDAQFLMMKLYVSLCHTSLRNFILIDWSSDRIKLEETKDSIEMKQFGKVLSEADRKLLIKRWNG